LRTTRYSRALREHRERAGIRQTELAEKVGVTGPYISLLESGKRPPPSDHVTLRIERVLGMPPKTLLRLAHIDRTPEDIRRVLRLDELYPGGELSPFVRTEDAPMESRDLKRIPLINRVSAGYPTESTDLDYPAGVADEYVVMPDMTDPKAFAIMVCGDSMAPRFLEGDVLIISPNAEVHSGDFCFLRVDSDGEVTSTFKQVFFDDEDTVRLESLNRAYPSRTCDRRKVTGIYRAVRRLETL
jgi:phage repressor protein C with HTH and peptisase S24 domain